VGTQQGEGISVRLTIKMMVGAIAWTIAIALALGRTVYDEPALTVWAALAAAFAAVVSAAVVLDVVAGEVSKRMLRKIAQERDATVRKAVQAMREDNQQLADRIVERLVAKQDKTVARVAAEIAEAVREESRTPTPIR
jgi:hypothetical protein